MSLREENIGGCRLILGNALEVMPTLEPVDLIASDVPYALTTGGIAKSGKTMSGIFAAHNYANDGQLVMATVPFPEMFKAMYAALADDADCYVTVNDKNIRGALNAADAAGFGFHNILPWDKVGPTANRWYMKHFEFTLYFWKGNAKTINNPSSKQGIICPSNKETAHPTEKPVEVMQQYIRNSTQFGETVLDPFMGSGTTLVAAARLGRKAIGIELEEKWFDVACERVSRALDQRHMFAAMPEPVAVQATFDQFLAPDMEHLPI